MFKDENILQFKAVFFKMPWLFQLFRSSKFWSKPVYVSLEILKKIRIHEIRQLKSERLTEALLNTQKHGKRFGHETRGETLQSHEHLVYGYFFGHYFGTFSKHRSPLKARRIHLLPSICWLHRQWLFNLPREHRNCFPIDT